MVTGASLMNVLFVLTSMTRLSVTYIGSETPYVCNSFGMVIDIYVMKKTCSFKISYILDRIIKFIERDLMISIMTIFKTLYAELK